MSIAAVSWRTICLRDYGNDHAFFSLDVDQPEFRAAPLEMTEEQFRSLGHDLIDRIASFLGSLRGRAVTPAESADKVRAALGAARTLPASKARMPVLCSRTLPTCCLSTLCSTDIHAFTATSRLPQLRSECSGNCWQLP